MKLNLDYEEAWKGIDRLAEKCHLSLSGLAKRAGLDPTSFNKSRRVLGQRFRWPSMETLNRVLKCTNTSFMDFLILANDDTDLWKPKQTQQLPKKRFNKKGNKNDNNISK